MEVLHRKVCRTSEQMRKEMAVLASLASTAIQKVIPKVVVSVQQAEPTTFMTSHIEGLMPIADNLDLDFMIHLGALAKRVHEIGNYQAFGFLDESLNIHQPIRFFSEFIERQIQKCNCEGRAGRSCSTYRPEVCCSYKRDTNKPVRWRAGRVLTGK